MLNKKLNIQWSKLVFTPSVFMMLLTAILLGLFISLGCWQLHRYEEKKLLAQQYQLRSQQAPLTLNDLTSSKITDVHYLPLRLLGHYDNAHTFLLDNQIHNHQAGYYVLTPFIANQHQQLVLINRGWVARNVDRRILPPVPSLLGQQIIQGMIYVPSKKTFVLSAQNENSAWPRVIQALDIQQMQGLLQRPLESWVLLARPSPHEDFVREWKPQINAQKNLSYALQWFTFAAVLLVLFIALNIHRHAK